MHPDLPLAVRAARDTGYQSITVDTNGYLFHDFLHRVAPDELDFLSFSLDGATRNTNDRIRGRGSYDQCIRGIREAVARNFATSLIYTVSSENHHELKMMGPLLRDLGIRRFFIQVIGLRGKSAETGGAVDQPELQVSAERWINSVPAVAEEIAESGIIVTYPKVFLEEGERFECAGRVADNYFIFPNGRVYRCPLCEDFPVNSMAFVKDELVPLPPINERDLFRLDIPEGCVMNKLVQPANIQYDKNGRPAHRIACCLLKEEVFVEVPERKA